MPNEADTCRTYIVPKLHTSGWEDDSIVEQLPLTPGRIVPIGDRHTRVAPVLWADADASWIGRSEESCNMLQKPMMYPYFALGENR